MIRIQILNYNKSIVFLVKHHRSHIDIVVVNHNDNNCYD